MSLKITLNLATILLFATTAHFANSAPTPNGEDEAPTEMAGVLSAEWEEARQIRNGVRTVKKQVLAAKRERREEPDNPTRESIASDNDLANVSAPAYVKQLYLNLSQQNSENTDATTIRSLPAIHNGDMQSCEFNFSISEVSEYEIFRRAELRIHMQQPSGDLINTFYLQLYHGHQSGRHQRGSYKKLSPAREGWVVFDVLDELNQWRDAEHQHKQIHFHIVTYTSEDDFIKGENGKDCHDTSIKFDQPTDSDADNQPLLMIYSHDLNLVNLNYAAIIEASNITERSISSRHRRSTGNSSEPLHHSCGKHNLVISLDTFNEIWHLARPHQDAIYPRSFDISICAGGCVSSIPLSTAQHSFIAYYLHTRGKNEVIQYRNAQWGECCAPVKYKSIETLFSINGGNNGEVRIVRIQDLSVEQCSCMTILQQTNSQRR